MDVTWIQVEPLEPLVLGGVRSGSNFLSTHPYLPGRVLRGAWAEWLLAQGLKDSIPARLDGVRIGNLFPCAEWSGLQYASLLPMSALSCKREAGFRSEPYPARCGHGVVDVLLAHLTYQLLGERGAKLPVPFAITCSECGDRMEHSSLFYGVFRRGTQTHYSRTRESFHTQTKVAISRYRRASVDGMLYNVTGLSPYCTSPDAYGKQTQLALLGRVYGPHEKLEELLEAVNATPIGALRTRGFGRVKAGYATVSGFEPIEARLARFNEALRETWEDLRRLAVPPGVPAEPLLGTFFSLDLLSPGVFRQHGVPTLVPELSVGTLVLKPVFWLTRPDLASGWSAAWGLPKPTDLAARAGSVYVFRWDGPRENLIATLEELEAGGIGERRDEGFGECVICHPFHLEMSER
jgi:CRISPR-associated protein Csx10